MAMVRYDTNCGKDQESAISNFALVAEESMAGLVIAPGCENCPFNLPKVFELQPTTVQRLRADGVPKLESTPQMRELLEDYMYCSSGCRNSGGRCKPESDQVIRLGHVIESLRLACIARRSGESEPENTPPPVAEILATLPAEPVPEVLADPPALDGQYTGVFISKRLESQRSEIGDAIIKLALDRDDSKNRLFSVVDFDIANEMQELQGDLDMPLNIPPVSNYQPRLF